MLLLTIKVHTNWRLLLNHGYINNRSVLHIRTVYFPAGIHFVLSLLKLLNIWELNGTNAYKLLLANIVVFVVSILGLALLYNIS